jgi:hypothetical protein
MGSYATISVNGDEVFYYKNGVNSEVLFLFDEQEKIFLKGKEALEYTERLNIEDIDPEDIEAVEVHTYKTKAMYLRDRLYTLGFNDGLLKSVFDECRNEKLDFAVEQQEYYKNKQELSVDMLAIYTKERNELEGLSFETWLEGIQSYVSGPENATHRNGPLELIEEANERIVLYAVLEAMDSESTVEFDLSDLYDGGWLSDDTPKTSLNVSWSLDSAPPILLTEGVFDREVLVNSLALLRPEVSSYMRFLDTDYKTEGGAGAVLKLLKSFAAAGISNRILVILDNDTAAQEAIEGFSKFKLPSHFRLMTLPHAELLEHYPTIGPQGNVRMNVNGLAGAIELYLGEDVLKKGNEMYPIQWTGYSNKVGAYQGELNEKSQVQKLFLKKIKAAEKDRAIIANQDWSGLELILDSILIELSSLR